MTHQPRRKEEIKSAIRSSLDGEIPGLTNFTDESFDDTWIDAYAEEIHDLDVKVLAAQFALWVDFAGNSSLTQTDLESVGVDLSDWSESEISDLLSKLNDLAEDIHLDQIGELVGVDRDPGTKATGQVTITTSSDTVDVNEGLEVATQPDSDGDYQSFFVDADGDGDASGSGSTSPSSGSTTVTVDVIAGEVGTDHNVGSGTITFLPDPDPGIESVTNSSETTGGEDEQTNDEYRDDLKGSPITQSGGGTAGGIEGAMQGVTGVTDAEIDEFQDDDPPHVDVIVDGGDTSDLNDEIDDVKSVGIRHDLVRPEDIFLGFDAEVIGTDIDDTFVQTKLEDYITALGMNENFRRSKAIQTIMNADGDIEDIGSLTILLTELDNESEIYNTGTDKYELDFAPLGDIEGERILFKSGTNKYELAYADIDDTVASDVTAIVDGNEATLSEGTDYDLIDDTSATGVDTIDFSTGGDDPDDRTVFEVEYELNDSAVDENTVTGTLSGSDHTFTEGTDYDLIDDNSDGLLDTIDWSIGGDSPDDDTRFFVDYDPKRVILNDLATSVREKPEIDTDNTTLTSTDPA